MKVHENVALLGSDQPRPDGYPCAEYIMILQPGGGRIEKFILGAPTNKDTSHARDMPHTTDPTVVVC